MAFFILLVCRCGFYKFEICSEENNANDDGSRVAAGKIQMYTTTSGQWTMA